MNAIGSYGHRDICARVDEQLGVRTVISHAAHSISREKFKLSNRQVILAQLDIVNSCASRCADS